MCLIPWPAFIVPTIDCQNLESLSMHQQLCTGKSACNPAHTALVGQMLKTDQQHILAVCFTSPLETAPSSMRAGGVESGSMGYPLLCMRRGAMRCSNGMTLIKPIRLLIPDMEAGRCQFGHARHSLVVA